MAVLQDYINETIQRAQYQITILGNEIVALREDNLSVDCNIDKIRELQAGVTLLQSSLCCLTDDELKIAADYLNREFDLVDLPLHLYDDTCLQAPIFTPRVNIKGDTGATGPQGEQGEKGDAGDIGLTGNAGDDGWAPIIDLVENGDDLVMRVLDWTGGTGTKPVAGLYISTSQGLVSDISQATNVRGLPGLDGNNGSNGSPGIDGFNGWSPILSVKTDGDRRVLRVEDWTGGTGVKPATGDYIGVGGLVPDIANGSDIRGAAGQNFSEDVKSATTADLGTVTYNSGALTITSNAPVIFPAQDDIEIGVSEALLVKNQADPLQNGIYILSDKGSVSSSWVLTRRDDLNTTLEFKKFVTVFVLEGTVQAEQSWTIAEDRELMDMDVAPNTWAKQKSPTDNPSNKTIEEFKSEQTIAFTPDADSDKAWYPCNFASGQNITIEATTVSVIGEMVYFNILGAGDSTVVGSGVTITPNASGTLTSQGAGDTFALLKTGTTTYQYI